MKAAAIVTLFPWSGDDARPGEGAIVWQPVCGPACADAALARGHAGTEGARETLRAAMVAALRERTRSRVIRETLAFAEGAAPETVAAHWLATVPAADAAREACAGCGHAWGVRGVPVEGGTLPEAPAEAVAA